ncbi:hypothetical protein K1T71_010841 [Dendrolimus kikuchii]|uniref:Uncharacterized protein n=1 Tax=Dendrolimus kikuchii TaxID=765133 RepID=A0ACC1CQC7_9NEOP|nr:hypothetical protein K1T71_010841 [Dendrolimus kikuchii]
MKLAIVLLALIGLAYSAPQPRKLFHEHFDDFMTVIGEEVGEKVAALADKYAEFDEYRTALDYMRTNGFKTLVYEMESLPEFQAVVAFLENDNIDVLYFIDLLNEVLDGIARKRTNRQEPSGKDFTSFVNDLILIFPKEKLAALYDQKMEEDEVFRVAMENLLSDEWDEVFTALWNSSVFQAEVDTLLDHGIDVDVLMKEILAIFGQN